MPKKNPPNPPSERPNNKALTIDLPTEQAKLLRQLSARTGLTQAYLREQLSRSPEVAAAITGELRRCYEDWKEETIADDLFGAPKAGDEVPDA